VRWGVRTIVAVALATSALGSGVAGAATSAKGSGLTPGKPCSYLSAKQVQKVFKGPVTVDPTNRGGNTVFNGACSYIVGPPGQPTGVLVTVLLFPLLPAPGQTAVDAMESQRATDSLSGLTVQDSNVGQKSYVNLDRSILSVAPSKKFAFTIQWLATGGPSIGGPLDAKTQKQLVTLAKQIVPRSPK
jgi:hypothetical protein